MLRKEAAPDISIAVKEGYETGVTIAVTPVLPLCLGLSGTSSEARNPCRQEKRLGKRVPMMRLPDRKR